MKRQTLFDFTLKKSSTAIDEVNDSQPEPAHKKQKPSECEFVPEGEELETVVSEDSDADVIGDEEDQDVGAHKAEEKKKAPAKFQDSWCNTYAWLTKEEDGMRC